MAIINGVLMESASLIGTIKVKERVEGAIKNKVSMSATVIAPTMFDQLKTYKGPYVVYPEVRNDIELDTENKRMSKDMTVKAIPYHEISNTDGITVVIGGIQNGL